MVRARDDQPLRHAGQAQQSIVGAGALPNEALQLTKREYLVGGPASRAGVIESRFAAERRCSTDVAVGVRPDRGARERQ